MVPVVPLVHLDPPWSAISGVWLHKVDQAGSRWTRSGPGAPAGPWCLVVDQGCSGPPWSTQKHFPDVVKPFWTKLTPERVKVKGNDMSTIYNSSNRFTPFVIIPNNHWPLNPTAYSTPNYKCLKLAEFWKNADLQILFTRSSCHPGVAREASHIKSALIGPYDLCPVSYSPVNLGICG